MVIQIRTWLALELCALLLEHLPSGECSLTAIPGDTTCPGVDMAFLCHIASTSGAVNSISNVRWRLTCDSTDVVPQLALTQARGSSNLCSHYGHLPITVTLQDSYSTLNITADDSLDGVAVECLLVTSSGAVQRETVQIQIIQRPPSPTGVHIISINNDSYIATIELLWDTFGNLNSDEIRNVTHTIIMSSNGETWVDGVARDNGKRSITLSYNKNYRLDIVATNCAGDSKGFSTLDILIGNCSAPILNPGVIAEPYNNTVEGAVIYFNCDYGYVPNERRMAVCQHNGYWWPELSNVQCERINSRVNRQDLLEENEVLFQCEKNSGVFLAVCTQRENVTNCSGCSLAGGDDHGSVVRAGFSFEGIEAASFLLGVASCAVAVGLTLMCIILNKKKKCDCHGTKNKNNIELSENVAYETIQLPATFRVIQK